MSKELLGSLELNRIYQMDCLEGMKLIPNCSIDVCISDIPYGINYDEWDILHQNNNSALGKYHKSMDGTSFKRRGKPINGWNEKDKKIPIEYQNWCEKWIKELFRITKEASPIILFSSRRYLHRVCIALENQGFLIRDIIVWEKDRSMAKAQKITNVLSKRGITNTELKNYRIGNLKPQYEPIIWAMKPYKKTLTDCVIENKIGGFNCENDVVPSNILKFPTNKKNEFHPTQKPLELIECLIKLFSIDKNHVIIDPFMGSGTTAVAALKCGRKFIGFEIEPKYIEIANIRIEAMYNEIDDQKILKNSGLLNS